MTRMQRWLLIGVAVALAAFLSGYVRGLTDTVPIEVGPSVSPSPTG